MSNCIAIICDNFWDNLLTTIVKNNSKEKEKEKEERNKSIRELYDLKRLHKYYFSSIIGAATKKHPLVHFEERNICNKKKKNHIDLATKDMFESHTTIF